MRNERDGRSDEVTRELIFHTIGFLSGDLLNVDDILLSVHICYLAIPSLELSPYNLNLIFLPDGHGADLHQEFGV